MAALPARLGWMQDARRKPHPRRYGDDDQSLAARPRWFWDGFLALPEDGL